MVTNLRLGKKPAVRPYGLADLTAYVDGRMPAPPAAVSVPHVSGGFPMFGNDTYGDCVFAGMAHEVQVFNALVRESDHVPTEQEVVKAYFDYTGGQDAGANISDVLEKWRTEGFFGQKILAYAPVNQSSVLDIHAAIAFYGVCKIGIACPESAQEQFQTGRPWTVVPDSPVVGGHDIEFVGYDSHYVYALTWGGIAPVTYPFVAKYADEGWAIIPHEFGEAGKGPRLNLTQLEADLGKLS